MHRIPFARSRFSSRGFPVMRLITYIPSETVSGSNQDAKIPKENVVGLNTPLYQQNELSGILRTDCRFQKINMVLQFGLRGAVWRSRTRLGYFTRYKWTETTWGLKAENRAKLADGPKTMPADRALQDDDGKHTGCLILCMFALHLPCPTLVKLGYGTGVGMPGAELPCRWDKTGCIRLTPTLPV